jgi:S1-C subfamily serine protease
VDADGTRLAQWDPLRGRWDEPRRRPLPPAHDHGWWRSPGARNAVVGGIVGALVASLVLIPVARRNGSTIVERRLGAGSAPDPGGRVSVVGIAAAARPWVVNINTEQTAAFLGGRVAGTGSGVVLRSDGYIVTSAHVVDGVSSIEVTLASGDKLKARTVGIDRDTDIAVVKVDRTGLPAAVIGTTRDLRVGDVAVAIGSPLGLSQTVTEGIISALGRVVHPDSSSPPLVDMIQTDAAITHGNSGGALINGDGAVVGINTAIATGPDANAVGIAFATPIDIAVAVAHELIARGHATHPWLGVSGANITPETAKRFGVTEGAYMVQVLAGGPAGHAGMRANDVVVAFGGEPITSMDELIVAIRSHHVGETVAVRVVRGGRRLTLHPTLAEKPETP